MSATELSEKDMAELRELLAKATPGSWMPTAVELTRSAPKIADRM